MVLQAVLEAPITKVGNLLLPNNSSKNLLKSYKKGDYTIQTNSLNNIPFSMFNFLPL